MENNISNNKRIAKNTGILYLRLIITMLIALYTSRVVLNALGVDDFGIYSVVGGIVAMFKVISGSLSAAITRFLTFELGKKNSAALKRVFSTSVLIQVVLCVIVVLFAETIGLWFVHNKMIIPEERMFAADWVFQFSLAAFCLSLINIPFNAVVVAHEEMNVYAYMSIYEAVAKLGVAFLLSVAPLDKLIFYAGMIAAISLSSRIIYGFYCNKHFEECRTKLFFDRQLFRKMFAFSGWNFIGVVASVLRDSGGSVVLSMFYPPAVNAARGIAMQVGAAVRSFSSNFVVALNPQITKSYAAQEYQYTNKLVFSGAKLSYFLMFLITLPVLCNTHYLLALWLKTVPDYAVVFVQLILIMSLMDSISETMITLMLATGNIRNYQIVVGGLVMLNLPLSYLFLRLGLHPQIVIIIAIVISIICIFVRIVMLNKMVGVPIMTFVTDVIIKIILVTIISSVIPVYLTTVLSESFLSLVISTLVCLLLSVLVTWFCGFNELEKNLVRNILGKRIPFLKNK